MIIHRSSKEISIMREAGLLTARALHTAGKAVEPGVTLLALDAICRKVIEEAGGTPSCLGYDGYPNTACISVNNVVVHGIPTRKKLREGDIVSIDVMAALPGERGILYHGDSAYTFPCGDISPEAKRLLEATEQSMWEGIKKAVAGNRISDVSLAVQQYAESRGYSVVRDYMGHGVGTEIHEDPSVPNYYDLRCRDRILPGMVFTVEPMINAGKEGVKVQSDGWTAVTRDGSLSAHFEHTLAITDGGTVVLTELT